MYTLDGFIREYDTENKVKKAVVKCLTKNMTKEVALDILSYDLQKRLYDFIWDSDDLDIDDGSNVRIGFIKAIRDILSEYFDTK